MTIYSMKTYRKNGKKWEKIYETEDYGTCYYHFASDMRAKYIEKAPAIKRVKRAQYYTHCLITVYYNNDTCTEYKCEA